MQVWLKLVTNPTIHLSLFSVSCLLVHGSYICHCSSFEHHSSPHWHVDLLTDKMFINITQYLCMPSLLSVIISQ